LFDAVECCLYGAFVWRVFRCFAPMAAAVWWPECIKERKSGGVVTL
jgi:hypothetical protein